ncbi:MAG: acetyl-CoA carboxylase carboxyltransferase subunit alpha [Caldisericia bacterium]|nr:acetyl-CoA carboxylase carboxyltransferase subunit alpha [Caldisericia bacterium]
MKCIKKRSLPFENSVDLIEERIEEIELDGLSESDKTKIERLKSQKIKELEKIYNKLSRWETVQVARHQDRPKTPDIVQQLIPGYVVLSGDRLFRDDPAIYAAIGIFHGQNLMIIGHDRGNGTKEKIRNNFGMANPEGYHKAIRLMRLAEKFNAPVLTLIDTQGAYPGIQAEEMGQSAAIATNLRDMFSIKVPIICVVIGEGGSGGALGIGVGNYVAMLKNSIYSVISPEGCASILWRDATKASKAAEKLQLTATDLIKRSLIDEIIPEPFGGAQRNQKETIQNIDEFLSKTLKKYAKMSAKDITADRYSKFRKLATQDI